MKKIICLFTALICLCFSLSAITVKEYTVFPSFPTKKFTSICYSQNFGFEFSKPSTNIVYSGTARLDFQDYFLDFNVGIANLLQYGGLYGKTFIDNKTGNISSFSAKDLNASQELLYGVGVAVEIPLKEFLSLNVEAGPSFSFVLYADKNDNVSGNFLFGVWTAATARFFPRKDYNLVCGIDVGYNFLNLALDGKTKEDSINCNYVNLRPFLGFSIKTDSWFRTLKEHIR